jgi:hypothetical protein
MACLMVLTTVQQQQQEQGLMAEPVTGPPSAEARDRSMDQQRALSKVCLVVRQVEDSMT